MRYTAIYIEHVIHYLPVEAENQEEAAKHFYNMLVNKEFDLTEGEIDGHELYFTEQEGDDEYEESG